MEPFAPLETIARTVTLALALGVVGSALLAAVVYVAIRCSRPNATTRHVLWWMVLSASVVLPAASIGASLRHVEHRSVAPAASALWGAPLGNARPRGVRYERVTIHVATATRATGTAPTAVTAPAAATPRGNFARVAAARAAAMWSAATSAPYAATALVLGWLAVATWALVALACSLVALRRIKREAEPLDDSVLRRLRRWRHSTRVGRPVAVKVSNEIDVPVAVGFRTPTILLPARVVEMEEIADLDQIAMHEYAHLNRYDDWTNLAQCVIERIFWFNPIVKLVGRQISLEREIACDDSVVAQTGRAHRYATCLWKLVESAHLPARPIVAPGALLTARQITIRIEQLLDARRNALPRLSPFGALAVGALCAALVVVAALRAPAIAIVDAAPPSPPAQPHAAPLPVRAPRAPQMPASVPSPVPAPKAYSFELRDVRTSEAVSPAAIATAVATAVAAKERTVVKATIATQIRVRSSTPSTPSTPSAPSAPTVPAVPAAPAAPAAESGTVATTAAALGERIGVDIGARVAEAFAGERPGPHDAASLERCFGCDFHGADLRGRDLHGVTIAGADLRGADLRGANLRGAKFMGANLRDVRLGGADLRDASFTGCDLSGTDLTHALLDGARIVGTSIRGANVSGARLRSLVDGCEGCDLRGLDLRGQDLRGVRIVGADLRHADLRGADLRGARLEAVDLREANVEGLKLDGASLVDCNVTGLALGNARIEEN